MQDFESKQAILNSATLDVAFQQIDSLGGMACIESTLKNNQQKRVFKTFCLVLDIVRGELGQAYQNKEFWIREYLHTDFAACFNVEPLAVLEGVFYDILSDNTGFINKDGFRLDWADIQGLYLFRACPLDLTRVIRDSTHIGRPRK